MPSSNTSSTGANLGRLLEELSKANIDFILVGGLAAVVQGAPITTMDVDIVHNKNAGNIKRLLAFLKSVDAYHRRPDDKIFPPSERDLSGTGHALYTTSLGSLDILATIEQNLDYNDLIKHTIKVEFHSKSILILDLDTIVKHKRASKRPVDQQRLPILEETLRQLKAHNKK